MLALFLNSFLRLRLNLHSLSVSELLEYGRTFIFLSCHAYIYFFL
jgi:hypothetical protein